jgi:Zn-dependent protease
MGGSRHREWVKGTGIHQRYALYLTVSLLIGMIAREFARASTAYRLGDPTPRLWGRLGWNPRSWFDPFGSGLLPVLILVLWAVGSGYLPPPVAYAKPAPIDPNYLRTRTRGIVLTSLAGPLTNLVLALPAALIARAASSGSLELYLGAAAFAFTNLCLAFFHLIPIPGLDGARLVALLLPPHAAEVYRNADQYLPLFVLVVLFVFSGPVWAIVYALTNAVLRVAGGFRAPFIL